MTILRALACAFKPLAGRSCSHSWDDYLDGAAEALYFDGEVADDQALPFGPEGLQADAIAIRGDWIKVGQYLRSAMETIEN